MARNNYATKSDVRSLKADIRSVKSDVKVLHKKLDSSVKETKSDNLSMKAEIIGEIKDMREENAVHQFSHTRINDEIQDHEKRIKGLETAKI